MQNNIVNKTYRTINRTYVQGKEKVQYHFKKVSNSNLQDILDLHLPVEQRHFIGNAAGMSERGRGTA